MDSTVLTATIERYEQVLEGIEHGVESYCEGAAEHAGEVAAFGDSWPGAMCELHQQAEYLASQVRMAQAYYRWLAKVQPHIFNGALPFSEGLRLPGVASPR